MNYDKDTIVFEPLPTTSRNRIGDVFGRLRIVQFVNTTESGMHRWLCDCECGNTAIVAYNNLQSGNTKSCGCLHREGNHITHGFCGTAEYAAFKNAQRRCNEETNNRFESYGGRGIEFRFESFEQFIELLGPKPSRTHTLDRKDVNGHYEPGNVRWATPSEQAANKRNNVFMTVNDVTDTLSNMARKFGVSTKRVSARRKAGWCDACSVLLPPHVCSHR